MHMNRRAFLQSVAAGAALGAVGCGDAPKRPAETTRQAPENDYFGQIAADLNAAGIGTPRLFIDLDRLDANAAKILSEVGVDRYRIVEKSLTSLDLLAYVQQQTGARKFMVLHLPFLPPILDAFPDADMLIGKAQPTPAVESLFRSIPDTRRPAVASQVQFIADSRTRLDELVALARHFGLTLRISVEIDVGLRRSGVPEPDLLPDVLAGLEENTDAVQFTGFLGYDGHVAHVPVILGSALDAVNDAWRKSTALFESYIDILHHRFPGLMRDDLVFNSGGSASFPMYQSGPVNDVAIGGGVVRPAAYPDVFCDVLQPAIFIATPVLAHYPLARLPFVSAEFSARLLKHKQGIAIYGGGWAANFISPASLENMPLVSDPENQNLVPNQSIVTAPQDVHLSPGDWVFMHPKQSDALFQFEEILLVRGGRLLEERWGAFPRRY
jgi:D-serine deaminase-like pyridoxal phosphate-dependent protein